jgi:hypothetical protein
LPAVAVTVIVLVPAGVVAPPFPLLFPPIFPVQPEIAEPNAASTMNAQKKLFHLRRDLKSPPNPNRTKANKVSSFIDP